MPRRNYICREGSRGGAHYRRENTVVHRCAQDGVRAAREVSSFETPRVREKADIIREIPVRVSAVSLLRAARGIRPANRFKAFERTPRPTYDTRTPRAPKTKAKDFSPPQLHAASSWAVQSRIDEDVF